MTYDLFWELIFSHLKLGIIIDRSKNIQAAKFGKKWHQKGKILKNKSDKNCLNTRRRQKSN